MAEPARVVGNVVTINGDESNASNIIKIGRAADVVSLFGAAGSAQPADASQAAVGAVTTVGANTGTAGAGLSLIGDTATVNQAAAIMNDFAALQEDISALQVLVNQLRSDLVALGLIKGSA